MYEKVKVQWNVICRRAELAHFFLLSKESEAMQMKRATNLVLAASRTIKSLHETPQFIG